MQWAQGPPLIRELRSCMLHGAAKKKKKKKKMYRTVYILLDYFSLQVYWFKDGKQISKRNEHFKMRREGDGTCSLHIDSTTGDDDGNYTIMAANPQVDTKGSALYCTLRKERFMSL